MIDCLLSEMQKAIIVIIKTTVQNPKIINLLKFDSIYQTEKQLMLTWHWIDYLSIKNAFWWIKFSFEL